MRYLKKWQNFNFINENVIRLTSDEKVQLEKIVDKIHQILISRDFSEANDIVLGPLGSENEIKGIKAIEVSELDYLFADGQSGLLKIYVAECKDVPENLRDGMGLGWYRPNDLQNKRDGQIVINGFSFGHHTDKEEYREKLRSILTHEIIHAKDPNFNYFKKNKKEQIDYAVRDEEIKAFTAQFVDLIESKIERWILLHKDNKEITQQEVNMLGQILTSFLLIFKYGTDLNRDILDFTEKFQINVENLNKKMGFSDLDEFTDLRGSKMLTYIFETLREISTKDHKRYKKFIGVIYRVIIDAVEKINQHIENSGLIPIKLKLDKVDFTF